MKLSIVILCWNDLAVIGNCLRSICFGTRSTEFEIVVSDNGSTDGSVEFIRKMYPSVRILENGRNLRFSKGNNVAISVCAGEFILILNPDTIVEDGALDKWVQFADQHPEAGAFGCRVLNADGSYQGCARPFPTVWREWVAALYLRPLGYFSDFLATDKYLKWKGDTERLIDWQAGCALLVRGDLLRRLGGFDEQFHYYYEDVDLCHRIWKDGWPIIYTPEVRITHLVGQSTKMYRIAFELDHYRNRYRYFYKYFGSGGVRRCRRALRTRLLLRQVGYRFANLIKPSDALRRKIDLYRIAAEWNKSVDPVLLVETNKEPKIGQEAAFQVPQ